MTTTGSYDLVDLADVLFASALQESEDPTPIQVRAAIDERLIACRGDCASCAERVAQEAGDHPEQYMHRMRWALRTVERVYGYEPMRHAS
jgi:hypothetical protein